MPGGPRPPSDSIPGRTPMMRLDSTPGLLLATWSYKNHWLLQWLSLQSVMANLTEYPKSSSKSKSFRRPGHPFPCQRLPMNFGHQHIPVLSRFGRRFIYCLRFLSTSWQPKQNFESGTTRSLDIKQIIYSTPSPGVEPWNSMVRWDTDCYLPR